MRRLGRCPASGPRHPLAQDREFLGIDRQLVLVPGTPAAEPRRRRRPARRRRRETKRVRLVTSPFSRGSSSCGLVRRRIEAVGWAPPARPGPASCSSALRRPTLVGRRRRTSYSAPCFRCWVGDSTGDQSTLANPLLARSAERQCPCQPHDAGAGSICRPPGTHFHPRACRGGTDEDAASGPIASDVRVLGPPGSLRTSAVRAPA